jgi:hypothetical protein
MPLPAATSPFEVVLINPYELGRQPFGLGHPWGHGDPRVDALPCDVQALVARSEAQRLPRREVFAAVWQLSHEAAQRPVLTLCADLGSAIPRLSEPWYCCAEPTDQQLLSF